MKKLNLFTIVFGVLLLGGSLPLFPAQETPEAGEKVRVLIFGNSFSGNSTSHLQELAKEGGKSLEFFILSKGGCSLQQHVEGIRAAEKNPMSPAGKMYKNRGNVIESAGENISALDGVAAGPWNYVSIQQASLLSFRPESYEPYTKELIEFIRTKMPEAKILVHETWAYQENSPLFKDGSLNQEKMYEALKANYQKLASDYKVAFLPIGEAFQAARKTPEFAYRPSAVPEAKATSGIEAISTPDSVSEEETAPGKAGSGGLNIHDAMHANTAGAYLGSCVWYEFLFHEDVTRLKTYLPKGLTPEKAAVLRKIAHETMAQQSARAL